MKRTLQWLGNRFGHQAWETPSKQVKSSDRTRTPIPTSIMYWVEQASQFIVKRLVTDAEPSVWYTCDEEGRLWWHAYDPVTGRSLTDVSEAEMRAWIEQRYASTLAG